MITQKKKKYSVNRIRNGFVVKIEKVNTPQSETSAKTDITLHYISTERLTGGAMNFIFVQKNASEKEVWITDRAVYAPERDYGYSAAVQELLQKPEPQLQYLEIGAGLGEFIPKLVQFNIDKKPIVIDPAPYPIMEEMLRHIQPYITAQVHQERCAALLGRAAIIQDSSKVILINTTLGEALKNHPELKGIGDIIIDNYGAIKWSSRENVKTGDKIIALEGLLLRDGGTLYANEFTSRKKEGIMILL